MYDNHPDINIYPLYYATVAGVKALRPINDIKQIPRSTKWIRIVVFCDLGSVPVSKSWTMSGNNHWVQWINPEVSCIMYDTWLEINRNIWWPMGTSAKTNPWLWGPVIALMVSTFLAAFVILSLAEVTACGRVEPKQRKEPVYPWLSIIMAWTHKVINSLTLLSIIYIYTHIIFTLIST